MENRDAEEFIAQETLGAISEIVREDGTGNLLHKDNYTYCVNKFKHSMQIITADGGIDVSNDFNKQEELVSKLIVSEVIYAITMQKKGGHFVLKIFEKCCDFI